MEFVNGASFGKKVVGKRVHIKRLNLKYEVNFLQFISWECLKAEGIFVIVSVHFEADIKIV